MRVATIDLGSNTVRLLVAEVEGPGTWRAVDQDQQITRLGEGLAGTGRLGDAARARTRAAVVAYARRARAAGAREVWIVATSAVREAANGAALVAELERATGCPVRVVSGEEEARLMLRGVQHGVGPRPGATIVFDIGGGSTEYILARDGVLGGAVSLRLGVVPLAERYPFPDGVEPARYRRLESEIAARLAMELPAAMTEPPPAWLVGTAGTVTTLAALDLGLTTYDAARVEGHVLDRAAVDRLRARLGALPVAARGALPCLEPGRADLIIPGIAIVTATMDRLRADALVVSDQGLREGVLVDALAARPWSV